MVLFSRKYAIKLIFSLTWKFHHVVLRPPGSCSCPIYSRWKHERFIRKEEKELSGFKERWFRSMGKVMAKTLRDKSPESFVTPDDNSAAAWRTFEHKLLGHSSKKRFLTQAYILKKLVLTNALTSRELPKFSYKWLRVRKSKNQWQKERARESEESRRSRSKLVPCSNMAAMTDLQIPATEQLLLRWDS